MSHEQAGESNVGAMWNVEAPQCSTHWQGVYWTPSHRSCDLDNFDSQKLAFEQLASAEFALIMSRAHDKETTPVECHTLLRSGWFCNPLFSHTPVRLAAASEQITGIHEACLLRSALNSTDPQLADTCWREAVQVRHSTLSRI